MKKLPFYQIDAFTGRMFGGNPAAVVLLGAWLSDDAMRRSPRRTISLRPHSS
jgi:predicted PhzF superfamily epimerase YddE/YHI9